MKRIFLTAMLPLLLLALGLGACKKDQPDNSAAPGPVTENPSDGTKVLAIVGDRKITESEVDELIERQKQQMAAHGAPVNEQMFDAMKSKVLDYLISLELFNQEAVRRGINIPDSEVDAAFNEEVERMGGQEQLQTALQQRGWTEAELKSRVKQYLTVRKIHEQVTADMPPATDEEAKQYFDQNQAQFTTQESVHAYHILIKVDKDAPDEKVKEAENKIKDILKEARKKDADFQELAKKYSQGPTGPKGGDLGVFPKGRMVPAFEEVAFALKVGEISDVVRTPFGFHIIKVTEHIGAGAQKFEDVRDNIIQMLSSRKKEQVFSSFIDQLKTDANITYPNPLPQPPMPAFQGAPSGSQPAPQGSQPKKTTPGTENPHGNMPEPAPGTPNPHK